MDWFHREVTAIENEARHFIDDSFKTLRSAEGAFDMLLNFRHIRSREAINSQMMKKFNDILLQFGKEVHFIYSLLHRCSLCSLCVLPRECRLWGRNAWLAQKVSAYMFQGLWKSGWEEGKNLPSLGEGRIFAAGNKLYLWFLPSVFAWGFHVL